MRVNVNVRRLLFALFLLAQHQNANGDETGELNDHESEYNAGYVQELLANEMLQLGETSAHVVVVQRYGLRSFGRAITGRDDGTCAHAASNQRRFELTQFQIDRVAYAARLRHHTVHSIVVVLEPPAILPVRVIVLTATVQLVL